jgi:beta-fructofuranosidase
MRTDYGWSGTMSLPRVLSLDAQGKLRMNPPAEIAQLHCNQKRRTNLRVEPGSDLPLEDIRGNSLELRFEMSARDAKQYGVKVCVAPNGEEQTLVYYDANDQKLKVDTTRSSLLADSPKTIEAGPLALAPEEPLKLRVFVDKSVVEVFANDGRQAVMRRMYPSRPDSLGVALFASGGAAAVPTFEAWELMPANPF